MGRSFNLHQLAKDSVFNIGRQIWSIVIGLLVSILLARGLGIENRGTYAVVIVLVGLLVTFLNAGVGVASTYYLAKNEHSLLSSIQSSIFFSTITSLAGLGIGLTLILFGHNILFPGIPVNLLLFGLLIVPITLYRDNLQVIFLGLQDFRTYNFIGLIPYSVTLIFTFLMVWWWHLGVEGALIANMFGHAASLIVASIMLKNRLVNERIFPIQINVVHVRQLLRYGLLVHLSNVIVFFNYRADVFLLNLLATKTSVGLYDVAVTLGERLWLLSSAVSTVIFPRIASLKNNEDRRQLTPIITRHVFWFVLIMAAITYVVAEWGIVIIFGTEYRGAALVLRLLLPGIIMESISKILANDLAGRGRPELNSLLATTASVINIVANLILIPHLDFLGSAIATSISYSILAITIILMFCRLSGAKWYELVIPTRTDLQLWNKAFMWLLIKLRPKSA